MQQFSDDDYGYLSWTESNPTEFVINSRNPPHPDYLILHRSSCYTISGNPANGVHWTREFSKTCSNDRPELENWAYSEVGGDLLHCGRCKP